MAMIIITRFKYCDFVLFAENGPVSIERIFRDEFVIADIIISYFFLDQGDCS